jgi:hypothetical protein
LFTQPRESGWIEVTSLPLVVVGRPLWQLGGARAVVLIPVLSLVLAAYAARRLSKWASGGDGWLAFWFVGLLSPALFYATDFWEHGPALALALLAVALVLEGGTGRTLLGGLAAGLAAVMRNDMFLVLFALGIGALLVSEERRRCINRWRELVLGAVACLSVLFVNALVWRGVAGSAVGSVRATQRVEVAGLHLAERARDAVITSVGVLANEYWLALVIGGVIGIGILLMASAATDQSGGSSMPGVVGAIVAWGGLAWRLLTYGVSTVPGFLPAAPIAALGLFGERTRREQVLFLGVVIAVPMVWMTEWVGGHSPQWGGRYLLLPTTLLIVLAAAQVRRLGPRPLVLAVVGLGAVMSVVGMTWHVERTRSITQFASDVLAVPADTVIIGDQPWTGSEIGSWYGERRWLTAGADDGRADPGDIAATVATAKEAGASRVDIIDSSDHALDRIGTHPDYPGFQYDGVRTTKFLWTDVVIRRYEAA